MLIKLYDVASLSNYTRISNFYSLNICIKFLQEYLDIKMKELKILILQD